MQTQKLEYRNLPAVVKAHLPGIAQPENYQRMVEAINTCLDADECGEWANRAAAAAAYYKQAQDKTLEHKALRIRLRAQLKCWELINELNASEKPVEAKFSPTQRAQLAHSVKVPVPHRNFLIDDSPPITLSRLAKIGAGEEDEPRPLNNPIRNNGVWTAERYEKQGIKVGPNKYPNCNGYILLYDCARAMNLMDATKEGAKMPPEANKDLRKLMGQIENWLYNFEKSIPVRIRRRA